jgi:transposase
MASSKRAKSKVVAAAGGGLIVGSDPHRKTVTSTVIDERGGAVATETFRVSGDGHRAMEAWASSFGTIARWGIEGAAGLGRHTAMFLIGRDYDVRDVCPNRTHERRRARQGGKTDIEDSLRIARETLADPSCPMAFKQSQPATPPDDNLELMMLWHRARRSVMVSRQHLLNEADNLLVELPDGLRERLCASSDVRVRLADLANRDADTDCDRLTALRLQLLDQYRVEISELDARDEAIVAHLATLVDASGSTLGELCGLSVRSVAELLVETGDPLRFTGEGGFARFNGTAPLPASTAEGKGQPVRHRLNPGGNRRVNAVLHRMAVTQTRCEPRAREIIANARRHGHTKKEARRILKRRLSDVVYRRMIDDLDRRHTHADST